MVRFPRALALLSRAVWRLSAFPRLRRALTCRAVISGWEAANRGDFELALALYHPDVETIFDRKMVEIGFEPVYGGRESRLDRLLTLGRMKGRGLVSGAAVDTDWGALFTTSDGLVIREQIFLDRGEALEAVGLKQASARERPG